MKVDVLICTDPLLSELKIDTKRFCKRANGQQFCITPILCQRNLKFELLPLQYSEKSVGLSPLGTLIKRKMDAQIFSNEIRLTIRSALLQILNY